MFLQKIEHFLLRHYPIFAGSFYNNKKVESILQHTFKNNAHVIEEDEEEVFSSQILCLFFVGRKLQNFS